MNARRVCSYPVLCIKSKGAILMIWVSTAVHIYLSYVDSINYEINQAHYNQNSLFKYLALIFEIFYPLIGWIADAWIGRYRAILYGLYSLMMGCVFITGSVISYEFILLVSQIFLYACNALNSLGKAAIYANILTDQMIVASSDELSTAVHWWFWSLQFPFMVLVDLVCALKNTPPVIISLMLIYISFSGLTIASLVCFLVNVGSTKHLRSLTLLNILLKYLTMLERTNTPGIVVPSHTGNEKTTFRLIPIIFICAMVGTVLHVTNLQLNHMTVNRNSIFACFFSDEIRLFQIITTFRIPLYHFIIRPLIKKTTKYTPNMLTIFGPGLFIQVLGPVGMVVIETIGHLQTPNVICMFNNTINEVMSLNYYWTMIPLTLQVIGSVFYAIVLFEFIIAQSPYEMKGFLFGLWFAFSGIAKLIGYNLYRPFQFLPASIPISCGFYYYLTQTFLLSLVFIIFLILSKNNKLRMRNSPVNIHMIAETHITAYIYQEEKYFREIDKENYSINSLSHGYFGATCN